MQRYPLAADPSLNLKYISREEKRIEESLERIDQMKKALDNLGSSQTLTLHQSDYYEMLDAFLKQREIQSEFLKSIAKLCEDAKEVRDRAISVISHNMNLINQAESTYRSLGRLKYIAQAELGWCNATIRQLEHALSRITP